jgi:hypothetical protein
LKALSDDVQPHRARIVNKCAQEETRASRNSTTAASKRFASSRALAAAA